MNYNIILCGFMGCGKTTVGIKLSEYTKLPFIDIDKYIERQENMTIREIFKKHGEVYFRNLEYLACLKLSLLTGKIIALGGGTLMDKRNVESFNKTGKLFFLDVLEKNILNRLENDTSRPLLNSGKKEMLVHELYIERISIYERVSDFKVDANGSVCEISNYIIGLLGL